MGSRFQCIFDELSHIDVVFLLSLSSSLCVLADIRTDMSVSSSSNSSLHPLLNDCLQNKAVISIFMTVFIGYILLAPLYILVLSVGFQRWRKQGPVATSARMADSDIFTYNMAVLELICLLGFFFYCCGAFANQPGVVVVGSYLYGLVSPGQTVFHLLTCVERYVAVVHPITYLGLRQSGRLRIRYISVGCVWLLCFGSLSISTIDEYFIIICNALLLFFSCCGVFYFSLSVLCILIRPGPGEVGEHRVDKSKQRAFYTIMGIMGALLLKLLSTLVSTATAFSGSLSTIELCLVGTFASWFNLPSSLVLPLLLLHRAGKLPGCKLNTESG